MASIARGFGRRVLGGTGIAAVAAVGAVALSSCAAGTTTAATHVTDVDATLQGTVTDTVVESADWWFEWGTTTDYGQSTPHHTMSIPFAGQAFSVAEDLHGLAPGTTYHDRVCTRGADGGGVCGADQAFTTSSGRDSVTGTGIVLDLGFGYVIGADVYATSGDDGAGPVAGDGSVSPGTTYFKIPDEGTVTCLRVAGNRAAVGLMITPPDLGQGDLTPFPRLVFIEDNGPTGDRLGFGTIAAPATDCPVPTADDFPGFPLGGQVVPPQVTSGDFSVHDASISEP
jgi:hypothetical protein